MASMTLTTGNETLHVSYFDAGTGDAVVLLHGWGARAETYRLLLDHLTPHFRVIAPDLPGFGGTDEPSYAYDAADYARFVRDFLMALGVQPSVMIGHSHGGRTILRLVTDETSPVHPAKIVLIDSAGLIRKKSFSQKVRIARYKLVKKLVSVEAIGKRFPDLLETMRRKNGSADYAAASPVMRQSMVKVINEDMAARLPKVEAPTLLLWGEQDTDTPLYMAHTMEKTIPDAGLVVIPGAGHFSFLKDFPFTCRVLDSFLGVTATN